MPELPKGPGAYLTPVPRPGDLTGLPAADSPASAFGSELIGQGLVPFFGTPCGILEPLYTYLLAHAGLTTITREDNAIGVAAGSSLAGRHPVVLMQNSGLGQSVNALASLVVPYQIPMLLVIGMRGTAGDSTAENRVMGSISEPVLRQSGLPVAWLDGDTLSEQVGWARHQVVTVRTPAALLLRPSIFGWHQ